jgi:hypothetical protein
MQLSLIINEKEIYFLPYHFENPKSNVFFSHNLHLRKNHRKTQNMHEKASLETQKEGRGKVTIKLNTTIFKCHKAHLGNI